MANAVIMSITLRKDDTTRGILCYEASYQLSEPSSNGHAGGVVLIPVGTLDDAAAKLMIRREVAAQINRETESELALTENEVMGIVLISARQ